MTFSLILISGLLKSWIIVFHSLNNYFKGMHMAQHLSNTVHGDIKQRETVFDNLRTLFVIGVVLQHASMSYNWSDWWPVTDDASILMAMSTAFFDGFLMPSLFFIAGYFAIPSVRKRSVSTFVIGKLRRLGIPWLVCILFICPILPLLYHYTRNGLRLSTSYWETWQTLMKNTLQFDFGLLPPMTQLMQNDLFYQRYMWFIGLLLSFFLLFAVIYRFFPKWFEPATPQSELEPPRIITTVRNILVIGIGTFVGSTVIIGIMFAFSTGVSNPETWFTLGNIIQFRVSRIFLHSVYFILGIWSYKKGWIQNGQFPGHRKTCLVAFLLAFVTYYISLFSMKTAADGLEQVFGMIFWFCLNFFTITALGVFISFGQKYLNKSTSFSQSLASHSYNIYLAHYLFVLAFQLLLVQQQQIPVEIKYILVSVLSVVSAYLSSRLFIRPYPRLTILAVTGLFALMVFTINP